MFRACLVIWLLVLLLLKLGAMNGHLGFVVGCHDAEREALLKFKQGLNDTQNRLSSWEGKDCCLWEGVGYDNVTSYVNRLDLHDPSCNPYNYNENDWSWSMISAKLDRSLVELSRLNYLELSCIDFQGNQIPGFIGSFKHLRYLNLSSSNFGGVVPSQIGNLTKLRTLDIFKSPHNFLIVDNFLTTYNLSSDFNWVSKLVSLQYLNMNNVLVDRSMNSTHMLNMPPLLGLQLSNCQLDVPTVSSLFTNFTWISTIQQLDLSYNYLRGSSLPTVFVNMTNLRYLDISRNQLSGSVPLWIKNMRKLLQLDLSSNMFEGPFPYFANMTSLTYLDLSSNDFSGLIPLWIQKMGKLQNLNLRDNNFSQVEGGAIMGILGNLCNLKSFDLEDNHIGGEIGAHHNLSKCATYDLEDLELSGNMIGGTLPSWLGDFKSLTNLNIANNAIEGPIPVSIGSLSYLEELDISGNSVNGTIPQGLGQCKALVTIDLSSNNLQSVVSESHFANLSRLNYLDLSSNSLEVNLHSNWTPPFQLFLLSLKSCKLQTQFPQWVRKQTRLRVLDLSDNMLCGNLDPLYPLENLEQVDISHNQLTGPVPYFSSSQLNIIDLSYNLFSGSLVHSNPSAENKNDTAGVFVCHLPSVQFLDLQGNNINGTIPDCWNYSNDLAYINLSSNNLYGIIPMTMGQATSLQFLKLSNNSLQGPIPPTLSSSSILQILDLGEKKLVGNIPITWNGKTLPSLDMLRLRGNQLEGVIPLSLCSLPMLQLIDLAHNNLTRVVPRCFGKLIGMGSSSSQNHSDDDEYDYILSNDPLGDITTVVLKGVELQYTRTLKYVVNLDLSCNALVGSIPDEITNLTGLIGLNLSDLTSLTSINLSNNKLHGQIPTGNQLQTLIDPSAYEGNPGLCGDPLPNKCGTSLGRKQPQAEQKQHDKEDDLENPWFYFVIISGVAIGFWGVVGSLLLKDRFKFALFQLVGNVADYLYAQIMIRLDKFRN